MRKPLLIIGYLSLMFVLAVQAQTLDTAASFLQSRQSSTQYNSFRLGMTKSMPAPARKPLANATGKTIVVNAGTQGAAAIQAILDTAVAGDTVNFTSASSNGPLKFKSGVTYTGSLSVATDTKSFAVQLPSPAQNITINLTLRANCGGILATGPVTDSNFYGDYSWGGNGTYYNRLAIRALNGTTRCRFVFNAHDALSSDRTIDLYDTDSNYYDITQTNVNDGGHIDGTHNHDHIARWVITNVHRMGLEYQDNGSGGGDDILIENFVCNGHVSPYNESFGISLMPQRHTNVRLVNAYCNAGTQAVVSGNHKGYGIENGFSSGSITGAVVVGDYVAGFACAMKVQLIGCMVYGSQLWGPFTSEPGLNGQGTVVKDAASQGNLPIASAPPAPAPASTGGSTATQPTSPAMTITITGNDPNNLPFAINDPPAGYSKPTLKITTAAGEPVGGMDASGNPTGLISLTGLSGTLTGPPAGWDLLITPMTAGNVGQAVALKMSGTAAPYPAGLKSNITLKLGNPPPPSTQPANDPVTGVESIVHHQSGKTETTGIVPVK